MSSSKPVIDQAPTRRLWTIQETADALRVSSRTVRRMIALGKLRTARLGRCVRVVAASVDELISGSAAQ